MPRNTARLMVLLAALLVAARPLAGRGLIEVAACTVKPAQMDGCLEPRARMLTPAMSLADEIRVDDALAPFGPVVRSPAPAVIHQQRSFP